MQRFYLKRVLRHMLAITAFLFKKFEWQWYSFYEQRISKTSPVVPPTHSLCGGGSSPSYWARGESHCNNYVNLPCDAHSFSFALAWSEWCGFMAYVRGPCGIYMESCPQPCNRTFSSWSFYQKTLEIKAIFGPSCFWVPHMCLRSSPVRWEKDPTLDSSLHSLYLFGKITSSCQYRPFGYKSLYWCHYDPISRCFWRLV